MYAPPRETDRSQANHVACGHPVSWNSLGSVDPDDRHDLAQLLEKRDDFLRFLEPRVGNPEDAEDLLHEAYLKGLRNDADALESPVAWFYRVLRNSVTDLYRRRATTGRARELFATEQPSETELDDEIFRSACLCAAAAIETLRDSYREILREVDLDERPLTEVAENLGISPTNARVRLHRARRSLRETLLVTCGLCAEHGCLDCDCPRAGPSS